MTKTQKAYRIGRNSDGYEQFADFDQFLGLSFENSVTASSWASFGAQGSYSLQNNSLTSAALPEAPGVGVISIPNYISTSDLYGLLTTTYWTFSGPTKTLSYGFATSPLQYSIGYEDVDPSLFVPMLPEQADVLRKALNSYSSISKLAFQEVQGDDIASATLRFASANVKNATAQGYFPSNSPRAGDAWFYDLGSYTPEIGTYEYHQMLHEIGHTLGLKHPHNYLNFNDGGIQFYNPALVSYSSDSMEYSVMSYRSFVGQYIGPGSGYTNGKFDYAQSLMMLDIQAIQYLYGANYDTNSDNTVYTFSATTGEMFVNGVSQGKPGANRIFRTIWDGGGKDTYDLSNYTTNLIVRLDPGSSSTLSQEQLARLNYYDKITPIYASGNVYNALLFNGDTRSLIENAIGGAGNDCIYGNQADNSLYGGDGDDYLSAISGGRDTLSGGRGDDYIYALNKYSLLYGDSGNDRIYAFGGTSTLFGGDGNGILDGNYQYSSFDYSNLGVGSLDG